MVVTIAGMLTDERPEQPLNAAYAMALTGSEPIFDGISTAVTQLSADSIVIDEASEE
ncbi:hypothetical protein SDC9_191978 [bioreactor metagenome]|uniref:Uncharacterized protein n=1 Tax=bioreactor metagenome TaxID=1076179 RepID=A0A645IAG1_9ZZZZ